MFLDVRIRGEFISVSRVIHISLQTNLCSINLVCICYTLGKHTWLLVYHFKRIWQCCELSHAAVDISRWQYIWCSTLLGYRTTKLHGPLWRQAWEQMTLYRFLPDLYHKSPWYLSLVMSYAWHLHLEIVYHCQSWNITKLWSNRFPAPHFSSTLDNRLHSRLSTSWRYQHRLRSPWLPYRRLY